MTSKLDPQELERLSKSAEQEDDDVRYYGGPTSTHRPARDAYHAALVQLHRTGQLVPAMPSASCDLCAAECRGHPLGDSAAWEPEPGSREWARRNPAMPSGDVVEAVALTMTNRQRALNDYEPLQDLSALSDEDQEFWREETRAAITTYEAVSGVAKMRGLLSTLDGELGLAGEYGPDETVGEFVARSKAFWAIQAFLLEDERARAALGEKP